MSAPSSQESLVPFVADSIEDAVTQVRAKLGPSAVVVHVRRIEVRRSGWLRGTKQRLEILAYRPEASTLDATSDAPAQPSLTAPPEEPAKSSQLALSAAPDGVADLKPAPRASGGSWSVGGILESSGFLPVTAQRVIDQLRRQYGETPPSSISRELELVRSALTALWRPSAARPSAGPLLHVFVGGPGVGKTTCLCKWVTQAVLVEGRPARVWRLDGQTANTAESLSVHCEILGIPMERSWAEPGDLDPTELHFIDVPGVPWSDRTAVTALSRLVASWGAAQVHLVMNGAYEVTLLLQQARAFSVLPITDLIVTHLDEELRWGKIWNLVLGTNYSVGYLSAGQNIPGDFFPASPESLFGRQFPS